MRASVYARYSSDLQRATSVDDQIRVARDYARLQGWTIDDGRIYTDAGISGASIDGRPGLQALMAAAAVQPRPFDVLLVDDSSRVARDIPDAIRVLQTLKFFGVRVVYISQHIDSDSEQAETLVAVHGMVDSLYLREAAKKIKRGLAGQHARGFATGSITFGYRTVPVLDASGKLGPDGRPLVLGKCVEVVPEEAETIRGIFGWYVDGYGIERIVRRLHEEGRRGPRGHVWRASAVRTVLGNEKYRGFLIWGKQTVDRRPGTRQRVLRPVPRAQWHVQERPELRIVSDELWNRARARQRDVQQALGLTAAQPLVRGRHAALHSRHLFSGFLRCGVCGASVSVVTGGYGSPRYGCPRSWKNGTHLCANRATIRAKVADAALLAGIRAELLRPETVQHVTEALARALNAIVDQRPALRARAREALSDAQRRMANLIAAIESGNAPASLFEALRARESEVGRLEAELEVLEEPIEHKLAVMPTWVRQQLEDTAGLLSGTPERAKAEFKRLGVSFTLYPQQDGHGQTFLRAEATTEAAQLISGQYLPCSTSGVSDLRSDGSRQVRLVVDLPASRPGPGWRRKVGM